MSIPVIGEIAHAHEAVAESGAVVIRGESISDVPSFGAAARTLLGEPREEREPFAPRHPQAPGIYSATVWPEGQPMCMHHELSYALEVPRFMLFGCLIAPESGGATALADGAAVLRDLPPSLVEHAERTGWRLQRNHNEAVGIAWQEAFGCESRAALEEYCRANDIQWAWGPDGSLRTSRIRPAVRRHPLTGERVWLNQLAFLNEWTMEPAVREYLLVEFGEAGLPFTTHLGDGKPLDSTTVDLINDVYAAHTVREPWQAGDLLLVDNHRMAHAREAYTGDRWLLAAMA